MTQNIIVPGMDKKIQGQKNILIYYQNPSRSIFFESFAEELIRKGHKVFFVTKCVRGILHQKMEDLGAITASYNPRTFKVFRFILHWWFLIKYCRRNKIEIVYSHLQLANLVALLAQYFIRAKVFPCRHHADAVMIEGNTNAIRIDKWNNRLAKKIIVVSAAAKNFMISREGVKQDRVVVIPLGYNFNLYSKPDPNTVAGIRKRLSCRLLLIIIGRMMAYKRHMIALQVLDQLVREGMDIKMILLDNGPEENNLRDFVHKHKLEERVLFTGFLNNTMDYTAAAELLLHPSSTEASNQVVREAAILGVPCIACEKVGDFDEYIVHRENSFLVSKENTTEEMYEIVREYYTKKDELREIGERFRDQVKERFDITKVVDQYLQLAG